VRFFERYQLASGSVAHMVDNSLLEKQQFRSVIFIPNNIHECLIQSSLVALAPNLDQYSAWICGMQTIVGKGDVSYYNLRTVAGDAALSF
jgi:hypothetical protein